MLRPSSVRDDTYVSYSKTNYELTTEISNFENLLDQKVIYFLFKAYLKVLQATDNDIEKIHMMLGKLDIPL